MPRRIEKVLDTAYMKRFFQKNVRRIVPSGKTVAFLYPKYLRFLTAATFLVHYEMDIRLRNGRLVTKFFWGRHISRKAFEIMTYLHRELPLLTPKPLYYLPHLSFVIYEELAGRMISEFDHFQSDVFMQSLPHIAESLARLHNLAPLVGNRRTAAKEKKHLELLKTKVQRYNPAAFKKYRPLVNRLESKLDAIFAMRKQFVISHGDFQASNIVFNVRTSQAGIIDFSDAELFYPTNDVASFLVHTHKIFTGVFPPSLLAKVNRLFLTAYYKTANKPIRGFVKRHLDLFIIRTCLDVIATVSVFMEFNKSPYYRNVVKTMFSEIDKRKKILSRY